MVLVPATMELLGDRNWWLPKWLDRILPSLNVEGRVRRRRRQGQPDRPARRVGQLQGHPAVVPRQVPGREEPGGQPRRLVAGRARRGRQPEGSSRHARQRRRQPGQGAGRDRPRDVGAVQADDVGSDTGRPEERRWELGGRVLRHHRDHDEHHDRDERAEDVRRPEEARVQGQGGAQRRPA